jgi:hypothetical protein
MDVIGYRYRGIMRGWNGELFPVLWAVAREDASVFAPGTPFRSGLGGPYGPFDLGWIGEIPAIHPPGSRAVVPATVCDNCYVGIDPYWRVGWPPTVAPVVLGPDGWPVACGVMGAFTDGYDDGYDI